MSLPQELEQDFWQEVTRIEEERRMPYISSIERIAIQQGIEQSLQQMRQILGESIELSLRQKFGDEGLEVLLEIVEIEDIEQLRAILKGLLTTVNTLDELRQLFAF